MHRAWQVEPCSCLSLGRERQRAIHGTFAPLGPRYAMLQCLLWCAALSPSQASASTPAAEAAATPPPAVAPERWILMKALQGSGPGTFLDSERVQVTGWTEGS